MKKLLIFSLVIILTSCGNERIVKFVSSPVKVRVMDYDDVYHKGDTLCIRRTNSREWGVCHQNHSCDTVINIFAAGRANIVEHSKAVVYE